ncbi:hypothetical protein [Prosthecobacter debontii]|nr:hypothetical protein [Prosthecobacter debontii]
MPRGYEKPEYVRAYEANRERAAALARRLRPRVEKEIQAWERRKS